MRVLPVVLLDISHAAYRDACDAIMRKVQLLPEPADKAAAYLVVYAMMAAKLDRLRAEGLMDPSMERLIQRVKEAASNGPI